VSADGHPTWRRTEPDTGRGFQRRMLARVTTREGLSMGSRVTSSSAC
jgi:hypothetical protein